MERFELDLGIFYFLEHLWAVRAVKWRTASQHFVNYTAKTPPVTCLAIGAVFLKHFRREVLSCAAQTICALSVCHVFFGQTKVSQ